MSNRGLKYLIRRKLQVLAYDLTSAEFVSKIYFKKVLGYKLNLKNPQSFNEKIQWLKIYEWPNNELAIKCTDKYGVREYIKEKGLEDTLNDLIDVYDSVDEIDFDKLPNQFALKCTHGCDYNIICDNKDELDIVGARKKLKKWMKEDFGKFNAEPHYNKIKPRIICEKFLGGEMTDYKFFCLNGKVEFMHVSFGLDKHKKQITLFDKNGKKAPFQRISYGEVNNAKLPSKFKEMKKMSEILAKEFKFVRVDWFEVNGKIYFSELTFTPSGGLMGLKPQKYDFELGKLLSIK